MIIFIISTLGSELGRKRFEKVNFYFLAEKSYFFTRNCIGGPIPLKTTTRMCFVDELTGAIVDIPVNYQ